MPQIASFEGTLPCHFEGECLHQTVISRQGTGASLWRPHVPLSIPLHNFGVGFCGLSLAVCLHWDALADSNSKSIHPPLAPTADKAKIK